MHERDPAEISELWLIWALEFKADSCSVSSVWHRSDLVSVAQLLNALQAYLHAAHALNRALRHTHYVTQSTSDQQVLEINLQLWHDGIKPLCKKLAACILQY